MNEQERNQPIGFPYATHLNILFPHLEKIDVLALARDVEDQWYNQTLCQVNGSVIRLGVMQASITGISMTMMMSSYSASSESSQSTWKGALLPLAHSRGLSFRRPCFTGLALRRSASF
jgi:hypothetical protein